MCWCLSRQMRHSFSDSGGRQSYGRAEKVRHPCSTFTLIYPQSRNLQAASCISPSGRNVSRESGRRGVQWDVRIVHIGCPRSDHVFEQGRVRGVDRSADRNKPMRYPPHLEQLGLASQLLNLFLHFIALLAILLNFAFICRDVAVLTLQPPGEVLLPWCSGRGQKCEGDEVRAKHQ